MTQTYGLNTTELIIDEPYCSDAETSHCKVTVEEWTYNALLQNGEQLPDGIYFITAERKIILDQSTEPVSDLSYTIRVTASGNLDGLTYTAETLIDVELLQSDTDDQTESTDD